MGLRGSVKVRSFTAAATVIHFYILSFYEWMCEDMINVGHIIDAPSRKYYNCMFVVSI